MKKVILLLIDSLIPDVLETCLRDKTIPALQFLIERGRYYADCATVFPTMTATVDSSLLTGVYPDLHRIPGLIWYDPQAKEMINYINGAKCVWKLGISQCAKNVLYKLNEAHLSKEVTTIYEELADRGRTSASINAIVHRGRKQHALRLPFLLKLATRFGMRKPISGPEVLTLGSVVDTNRVGKNVQEKIPNSVQGLRQRYGINDAHAVHVVKLLIQSGEQPDFMLVYLPDNDHEVHKKNPVHAEEALIQVDHYLQQVLNSFDSWDKALEQSIFIVTSDHGQTRIGGTQLFNIDLDNLLGSFTLLQLGEDVQGQELVVCNNERMAYIYPLQEGLKEKVLDQLLTESRIDIIAWKYAGGVEVREGGSGRKLYYQKDGDREDIYGSRWTITGEYSVLDLQVEMDKITFGAYPDVLSRLYGALYSQDIEMIVITARPRFQFKSKYHPTHLNGGSHGSLHKLDSLIPLIIAGTEQPLPQPSRLIDLKNYIIDLLS